MAKIYIVGTPIGNLKDITLRALETLQLVDIIACEDTRNSLKLLNHYSINKRLISYNKDNEKNSASGIIQLIKQKNLNVALISDAGMPLVSDPGFELIKQARENNIELELIPGVNAAISAFALSGLSNSFVFEAFPKEKQKQRIEQIKNMTSEYSYVFYVAPHKLVLFLKEIDDIWKEKATIFLAKEITKINETFFLGSAQTILNNLNASNLKGEFTLAVKIQKSSKVKINKYSKLSNNI